MKERESQKSVHMFNFAECGLKRMAILLNNMVLHHVKKPTQVNFFTEFGGCAKIHNVGGRREGFSFFRSSNDKLQECVEHTLRKDQKITKNTKNICLKDKKREKTNK